jgi:hypothetical protein
MKWFVMVVVPMLRSDVMIEIIITVLEHIAERTENTLDDEIIENIRRMS